MMACCEGPDAAHVPTQKSAREGGREYYLFTAAGDGCLPCVKHLVEVERVDVFATSQTCKYTALAFAEWEVTEHTSRAPQCASVVEYLRGKWVGALRARPTCAFAFAEVPLRRRSLRRRIRRRP